jgi:probable F420-dependent oxidoreductase
MHLGVYIFPTDYSIQPVELASALEERGLESLFVPEHTHIPLSRRTPWPGGGPLPKEYSHTHDPFVALSFAAAATKNLIVGTAISLLPQRDAIVTAKAVASLDMLSGGRFVLGLGAGWNQDEMENHGVVYADRFKLMEEKIQAMQAIWTQEEAAFQGERINFDPMWSYPKPVQKPHPPVILGGETKFTMRRIVKYCDGWLPRARHDYDVLAGVSQLSQIAAEEGRDMSTLQVSVFGARADADLLKSYTDAGIKRSILPLPSEPADKILPRLDRYAELLGS